MTAFRALVLHEEGGKVVPRIESVDESRLPPGEVTVRVEYSTLNYKDGMILEGQGRLVRAYPHVPGVDFAGTVLASDSPEHKAMHGLTRSLIQNAVTGVTDGFTKTLNISGVGYRAALQGQDLNLQVGYSHPVSISPREGIEFEVPNATTIIVRGIDKQRVGQTAAEIRMVRPPEPYKGKGIRYSDEQIRRKVGKAG